MGDEEPVLASKTEDLNFWDSFREITLESPTKAGAFFDPVCGQDLNWEEPDVLWFRRVIRRSIDVASHIQAS
jgi:hypothetical protein